MGACHYMCAIEYPECQTNSFSLFLDNVIEQQFSNSFFMLLSSPLVSEMSGIQGRIGNRTT